VAVDVERVQSVFAAAAGLNDPAERAALLDRECGGDAELRRRVERLLKAHDDSRGLPGAEGAPTGFFDTSGSAGAVVAGRYKLLEIIGEGGMGAVWLAEQTVPVKRKVALKLVKPGMDSHAVLARFEAERQALALMDHPNIARVLDGGATDQGRPFFVMELVKGMPLTDYCNERRLSVRKRLELFVPICQAVQHAHQKGIIHRDLKPSNILVTEHDERPVPKVIDFGLAKALGAATTLTERTLHTAFGTVVGTPLYMAPEQVAFNALDVDTRSDVYSLGVILYELLTGTTPLEKQRLREAAWDEIRRVIREEEPPRPSARLSDSHDALPSISAQRAVEPSALTKLVRGELDWIVMKALEKDRNRRYETANGFSMDVQRYLADEPVQACPPSASYRVKKFVRRNKATVVAASLVFLALTTGVVGATWGMIRSNAARKQSDANFNIALGAVKQFLGDVTDDPDLKEAGLQHVRRKLLTSAMPFFEAIAAQRSDDPIAEGTRAGAYIRLALIHQESGEYDAALKNSESAREIFAELSDKFPSESWYRHGLANALHNRGLSLKHLGKRDDAVGEYRQAISIMERLVAEAPSVDGRNDLAQGHLHFSELLHDLGKHEEAKAAVRQALIVQEKLAADFPKERKNLSAQVASHVRLGLLHKNLGDFGEAEKAFRKSRDLSSKVAASFPNSNDRGLSAFHESAPYGHLGGLLVAQGKFAEAQEPLRKAMELQEEFYRRYPTSAYVRRNHAATLGDYATVLEQLGKSQEGEALARRALGIQQGLAEEFPDQPEFRQRVAHSFNVLGNSLLNQGKRPEAEESLRKSMEIKEKFAAEAPRDVDRAVDLAGALCNLGILQIESGRPQAALEWLDKAIDRLQGVLAREPRLSAAKEYLANSHAAKANALFALGRHEEVVPLRERSLVAYKELFGPTHWHTMKVTEALIENYDNVKRFDDALKARKELLEIRRKTLGPDDAETLGAMANVATGHETLGNHAEAAKGREEALEAMKVKIPNDVYTLKTMLALAATYAALGREAESKKLRAEAVGSVRSRLVAGDPNAMESAATAAAILTATDRGVEAIPLIDEAVRRSTGKLSDVAGVARLLDFRLRHFARKKDAPQVRATVERFESLKPCDAAGLYDAACCRAIAAAVVGAAGGPNAAKDATIEGDRAMAWLKKAVAAGFVNAAHMKQDADLHALRDRDDFKKLIADLEAKKE
jgi:serine/threonine protein kinase/tetratricopeptide (TPR) repeat protein